jgi:Rieske Fe-S protein
MGRGSCGACGGGACGGGACDGQLPAGPGVDRRTFLAQSTLAAVAALLADACGDGIYEPYVPSTNPADMAAFTFRLADFPALGAVGGVAKVPIPSGAPVAVARTGASSYVALSMTCPHQGSTVDVQGSGFVCPNHGARFAAGGEWVGGQVTANLTTIPLAVNSAAGTLTVGTAIAAPPPVANGRQLIVTVTAFAALVPVGGIARVDGNSTRPVALVHVAQDSFIALSMICPHQGATIAIQSGAFFCPRHGARFSSTGTWLGGQRTSNLGTLPSTYDTASGTVTIQVG